MQKLFCFCVLAVIAGSCVSQPGQKGEVNPAFAYKIVNHHMQECLDVDFASPDPGTPVSTWQSFPLAMNQLWKITPEGEGYYKIQPVINPLVLSYNGDDPVAPVFQAVWKSAGTQKWSMKKDDAGYFKITPAANADLCLTVTGKIEHMASRISLGAWNGKSTQQWVVVPIWDLADVLKVRQYEKSMKKIEVLFMKGKGGKALSLVESTRKKMERNLGKDNPVLISSFRRLAEFCLFNGNAEAACRIFTRSLVLLENNQQVRAVQSVLPAAYLYYANMLITAGRQEEAVLNINKALGLVDGMLLENDPALVMAGKQTRATALLYLGGIEFSRDNRQKAEQLHREALEMMMDVEKKNFTYTEAERWYNYITGKKKTGTF